MMQSDTAGQAGDRQVTMVPRKIRKKRAHDLLFFCSLFVFTTVQVARRGAARQGGLCVFGLECSMGSQS
jgi:hypothetical protein